MGFVEVALYAVAGTGWFVVIHAVRQTVSRRWRAAAEEAGLTSVEETGVWGFRTGLTGRSQTLLVELGFAAQATSLSTIVSVRGILHGLALRREMPESAPERNTPAGLDTTTGDEPFDGDIEVHGPDAAVHALLDVETRRLVRLHLGRSVTVAGGEVRAVFTPKALKAQGQSLGGALRALLAVAQRLVQPDDVPGRLAHNVRQDTAPGVRLRNLLTLLRNFPDHPATREAVEVAREDAAGEVKLRAALALGPEGRGLLQEIASAEEGDDAPMAQAVAALGAELAPPRVHEILWRALRRRRLRTAEACLEWLGRQGGKDAIESLAKVVMVEPGALAAAAAYALGATGLPEAEAPLIRALGREGAGLAAAADALAQVGTAAAVMPLKDEAVRPGRDRAFGQATRHAIAAIQARLGGTPGQLSLAGAEAGQLDLAEEDPAGRLSLARPDPPESDG